MKVGLKCFASLANEKKCNFRESTTYNLKDGQTVEHLAELAGINKKDIGIAFVNSTPTRLDAVLVDGDRVTLTPTTMANSISA